MKNKVVEIKFLFSPIFYYLCTYFFAEANAKQKGKINKLSYF
jgi:hypothetical protein